MAAAGSFVLVHGAWHGAWAWDALAPLLPGHVEAVDLPGHGADATPPRSCTLDAYAARTVEALERAAAATGGPAVLVGHSLGGMTVAQAAELRPDLVRSAVFVCAYMPRDGESGYALARQDTASAVGPETCVLRPDDGVLEVLPDRITGAMYDGCDPETAAAAAARLHPEPLAAMGQPVRLSSERFGSVERLYVHCLHDRILTLPLQRQLVAAQPCRTVELDAGHSPALSHPAELAAVLTAARS
jgi:pimeloyl-ACP methyl ester carboxylesterase